MTPKLILDSPYRIIENDYNSCEPFSGSRFACITIKASTMTSMPAYAVLEIARRMHTVSGELKSMNVAIALVTARRMLSMIIHAFFLEPQIEKVSKIIP